MKRPPITQYPFIRIADGALGYLKLPQLTTVQRGALANVVNGYKIYNTTTNQVESYENGAWRAEGYLALATHIADLDAHTKNLFEAAVSGRWYMGLPLGAISTFTLANNKLYAMPFFVADTLSFSRIGIYVNTLEAGKSARLGVYKLGADLLPADLVLDAGEVSLAAVTEVSIALAPLVLTKGWYATTVVSDATGTAVIRSIPRAWSPWGWAVSMNIVTMMFWIAHAYGALPDPFGAGAFGENNMIFCPLKTS